VGRIVAHGAIGAALLLVAATVDAPAALPAASVTLPSGFALVDYDTGQAPYNLTNFEWLQDGGLLTSGKDGTITFAPPDGRPRQIAKVPGVRAVTDHGLLGFALANDYDETGHVFISYDKGDPLGTGVGVVEEWTASPASAPTSFTWSRTVLDGASMSPPFLQLTGNHGIDSVEVAPDDSLFLSVGDDSLNNGHPNALRAQDLGTPYGKLLHLTAEGLGAPGNPFYEAGAPGAWRSMVFAYGLRNPFRFALDPRSGVVHVGDVGWNKVEEVDTLTAGANAGWPCYEGLPKTTFSVHSTCQALYAAGTAVPPITSYSRVGTGAAVVGGVHYTGSSYPQLYKDSFFYGDYAKSQLWTLATDPAGHLTRAPEPAGLATGIGGPVAFRAGPNGDVTYADLLTGKVRRLVYTSGNRTPVAVFSSSNDAPVRTVQFSAADSYDLDGDRLTYSWDFGDGSAEESGPSASHSYAEDADVVTVRLTVRDQLGDLSTTEAVVHPANSTPTLSLDEVPERTYTVGDDVTLAATATDLEDGDLDVSWDTALLHCPYPNSCHRHPEGTVSGTTYEHEFTDHGGDTAMLVTARAVDSLGAAATVSYLARPRLRTLSVHSPVTVTINGSMAFATQAVAGSAVRLAAPTSSSYWRFQSWSDGAASQRDLTMPDADLSISARYLTTIDLRYAAIGGTRSVLRGPTSLEYDVPGGRAKNFSGGRLYWGPATGARWSAGPLLATYLAAGGPARFGLPVTDNRQVAGGQLAHFTGNRSILKADRRPARLVSGPIRTKFARMKFQRSCLGFPLSGRYGVPGGYRQKFQHGTITHVTRTGHNLARCRRR
jgi:glucose/arabinose dehydrogenase